MMRLVRNLFQACWIFLAALSCLWKLWSFMESEFVFLDAKAADEQN